VWYGHPSVRSSTASVGARRKVSSKVAEEVSEKVLEPIGLATPKKRAAYEAKAQEGSKEGRPARNQAVCWEGPNKVGVKDVGQ
jgi:hypothetical protein